MRASIHDEQEILVIATLVTVTLLINVNIRFPAWQEFSLWSHSGLFAYSQLLRVQEQESLCNVPKKPLDTMAHFNPGMNRRQRWIHKYFFHMHRQI